MLAEWLPNPPLTRNQVELMEIDWWCGQALPDLPELGIASRALEEVLQAMLRRG